MTTGRVEPSISSVSFSCPHCGAHAHQTWFQLHVDSIDKNGTPYRPSLEDIQSMRTSRTGENAELKEMHEKLAQYWEQIRSGELFVDGKAEYRSFRELENLYLSRCYSCEKFAVWLADRLIYPFLAAISIVPNSDLNEEIQRDFKEATIILDASPRGAAALFRLCVQKLTAQLGEAGDNINADIASLVKKGLDVHIQQALDIVRVIGNDAVHPGQIDLRDDRDTAILLANLINQIAEETVTRRKRINTMYATLPESKRKGIEERDKEKPT